jgi:hypothetical protein
MLHVFNVCLLDNHCPSRTGHRAHAAQTQTGPSPLRHMPTDGNGLALENWNSSGQSHTGVKARARAPPSRRGEDARCNKQTGWQANMHASTMTRMQRKAKCDRVRKGKEESNASRARAGRGRENGDVGPLKPGSPGVGAGAQTRCCGCRLQPTTDGSNRAQSWPLPPDPAQGTAPRFPAPPTARWADPDRPPKGTHCSQPAGRVPGGCHRIRQGINERVPMLSLCGPGVCTQHPRRERHPQADSAVIGMGVNFPHNKA